MRVISTAKQAKHLAFLGRKRVRLAVGHARSVRRACVAAARGYVYDAERYAIRGGAGDSVRQPAGSTFPVDHLWFPPTLPHRESEPVPRRLFLLWTGTNPMSANRERSVEVVRAENHDVVVELITASGVRAWEVEGHPLHPSYERLSAVHRSDYLRAYLMYHHGGAYLDIKPYRGRISDFLTALDDDPEIWAAGAPELAGNFPPTAGGPLAEDMRLHESRILSQAVFAFRPRTRFAAEWLAEVERRLDYFSQLLEEHPAVHPLGIDDGYPIPWFSLHGATFSPLALKHHERIRLMKTVTLSIGGFETYR